MKKAIAFGTFDIFHKGHESYLRQAKKLGDYLIVVVARDKTVLKIKKNKVKNNEQVRKKVLESSGLAEKIVLGNLRDRYAVIGKYKPDVITLGYDQEIDLEELSYRLKKFKLNCKIKRLKPYNPKLYKSSKLKK